jgi:hypothetical protein
MEPICKKMVRIQLGLCTDSENQSLMTNFVKGTSIEVRVYTYDGVVPLR